MTTIKEYKAMMDYATAGPWLVTCSTGGYADNRIDSGVLLAENTANASFIAASRNIAPDLIRVIELAEKALIAVNDKSHFVPAKVQMALTEIKKLKGE